MKPNDKKITKEKNLKKTIKTINLNQKPHNYV